MCSLRPALFSYLCVRVRILGTLKTVCGWANKTWLLPYACCGLHFTDSAACVLSFYHSTPLHIQHAAVSVGHAWPQLKTACCPEIFSPEVGPCIIKGGTDWCVPCPLSPYTSPQLTRRLTEAIYQRKTTEGSWYQTASHTDQPDKVQNRPIAMQQQNNNLHPKKRPKPADPEDDPASPRQKKTRADYSQEFRARVKANPELYHQHRAAENERNKKYMETRNDEAVLHNRELQRIRQQKYQGRLKEKDQPEQRPKTPQTRKKLSDIKTGKENDSRAKMGGVTRGQQSTRNEEMPMLRSGPRRQPQWKDRSRHSVPHQQLIAPQPSTGSGSAALRTASSRFRRKFLSSLPAASSTQAHVIAAGLQTLSPTTKRAVNSKLGIMSPKSKHRLDWTLKSAFLLKTS